MSPSIEIRGDQLKNIAVDIVTKHVNRWDPEHPLSAGVPDDEYETEIEKILRLF